MDLISMTLGVYINASAADINTNLTPLLIAESSSETTEEEYVRLRTRCNIEVAAALGSLPGDPLVEQEAACGKFNEYKKRHEEKNKSNT